MRKKVFRVNESADMGLERSKNYLLGRSSKIENIVNSEKTLLEVVEKYGPVVNAYPSWHPLVTNHKDTNPETTPNERCGYKGLDHTIYFVNAFITCPYYDGKRVIDSVEALPFNSVAEIHAKRLDVQLYSSDAIPILVWCKWLKPIDSNGMIPASIALPLMLQKEVPCWEWAERGESWETMSSYFLRSPQASRSTLFVSQETGIIMKKVWNILINAGVFGPVKN